ncbi:hypothetical protein GGF37_001993 [Kickxella alabastrina]|nr:hypothetical protein GGF37_001993 [Kickxella alabastrina]
MEPIIDDSLGTDTSGGDKPRIKIQLYKTEPCQNWALHGICRYGDLCKFAHGMCEQRSRLRHPKYKTSMCKDYPLGKCSFGERCNFAHSMAELRITLPSQVMQPAPSAQARALIQNPLTVLPDGRMLSTFTPVTSASTAVGAGAGSPANAKGIYVAPSSMAVRRVAGDLRRNQSMGTLRVDRSTNVPGGVVPVLNLKNIVSSSASTFECANPTNVVASPAYAAHPQMLPGPPVCQPPASPADYGKQPIHHLQREHANVARRVASFSHLPTARSSSLQTFSPAGPVFTSNASGGYLQGFLLGGNPSGASTVSHLHTSPLAQVSPSQYSPALSSASYREYDDVITPGPQMDSGSLSGEWMRAHNPQQQQQQQSIPPQQQLLKSSQRRTLTSSVSMQNLPRFKIPTNWDQPQPGTLSLSSSIPESQSRISSQNSAATLIDSDVWSSSACNSFGFDAASKPHESRFFPASSVPGNSAAANHLGSYYGARTHPHSQFQQQLRRQQSTDDWISLRNAHPSPNTTVNSGLSVDLGLGGLASSPGTHIPDNRLNSLDQLRTATSTRKNFNNLSYNSTLCL